MRITHLWRYPVKSLAGEPLETADLDRGGIPFDRRYQFLDGLPARKGKPLTARQAPAMLAYRAVTSAGAVRLVARDGSTLVLDESLVGNLCKAFGREVTLDAASPEGSPYHDAHDVLVVNAASVRALSTERGEPVNVVRFRPNVVLDDAQAKAYEENAWIGRRFMLGDAELEVVAADVRCMITTIDPDTLAVDSSLLKHLVDHHQQCFGVYCSVIKPGRVALGDEWRQTA